MRKVIIEETAEGWEMNGFLFRSASDAFRSVKDGSIKKVLGGAKMDAVEIEWKPKTKIGRIAVNVIMAHPN